MNCSPARSLTNTAVAEKPIDELAAFGRKARRHSVDQIKALKDSIACFGFVVPVLIDEAGKVLAGNACVDAARQLGFKTVPTLCIDHLSAAQKRAFIIAHNRLPELASWDRDTLQVEFAELSALELDFELTITGFSLPEIDAISFIGATEVEPAIPEPSAIPFSRVGDEWILGDHRLLCADATHEDALIQLMGGAQARACFTDPPYNVEIQNNVTRNTGHGEFVMASGEMSDAQFQTFLETTCSQVISALMPGGVGYLCIDWRSFAKLQTAAEHAGGELINAIVWDKRTGGMGSFYRSQHELILVVRKTGAPHLNNVSLGKNGRNRSNVWSYEGVSGFGKAKAATRAMHPTVKPLAMVRDALLDSTAKGEVVLDLFGGSGTTLIAAEMCGRRARLMELDPKYVDVIIRRFEDFTGKSARLAGTGQTFSEVRAERDADTQIEAA